MDYSIIWQILLQIALIGLNAVFACAEIAVLSMNDAKLAKLAEQGDKRAIRLARLTSKPARFLATIQVAITLSGFLGSAFAADNFSDLLVTGLINIGVKIPIKTLDTIAVIFITFILSYFTLVFGELVPKRIAMKKAEKLALGMALMITFISKVFAPLVWLLTCSTNGILKLFRIDPKAEEDEISEEDIKMMAEVGNQKGIIAPIENEIIQNVFEFDNITVGEFATHRTQVDCLWLDESVEEWEKTMMDSRHTFYPICNDSVDDVVGIINIKDYYSCGDKNIHNIVSAVAKQPYFALKSLCANALFKQMKKSRNHFAVVVDEFGGMEGIVTMNDILEQLVGDLEEETDAEIVN